MLSEGTNDGASAYSSYVKNNSPHGLNSTAEMIPAE